MNQNLLVNKTNFHTKGFALGLALKQRRNATLKSPISMCEIEPKALKVLLAAAIQFMHDI